MPKGFSAVKAAAEKISRNEKGDFQPTLKLKLPDSGDIAVVRFLEEGEEVYSYWYHDFSHVDKADGWKTKVPCLDQDDEGVPCPGCAQDLPRKFQGLINLIWRDAPVFKRDDEGRVIKKNKQLVVESYEDQVAVWEAGIEVFKTLAKKDVAWKGLKSRDAEITRDGLGFDTKYSVEPVDIDAGKTPLTKDDKELAKDTYDLENYARFKSADEFEEIIANYGGGETSEETDEEIKTFLNSEPFESEDE